MRGGDFSVAFEGENVTNSIGMADSPEPKGVWHLLVHEVTTGHRNKGLPFSFNKAILIFDFVGPPDMNVVDTGV